MSKETVQRGGPETEMVKYVSDPMQAAGKLQRALQQAGVNDVLIYQTEDRWTVKAQLEMPVTAAVASLLKAERLDTPENGKLKIEFAPVK